MNNEQLEKETFPEENQDEVSIHEDNLMETTEETVVTEEAVAEAVAETEEVVETEEMPKADEEIVEETVEETDEKSVALRMTTITICARIRLWNTIVLADSISFMRISLSIRRFSTLSKKEPCTRPRAGSFAVLR